MVDVAKDVALNSCILSMASSLPYRKTGATAIVPTIIMGACFMLFKTSGMTEDKTSEDKGSAQIEKVTQPKPE